MEKFFFYLSRNKSITLKFHFLKYNRFFSKKTPFPGWIGGIFFQKKNLTTILLKGCICRRSTMQLPHAEASAPPYNGTEELLCNYPGLRGILVPPEKPVQEVNVDAVADADADAESVAEGYMVQSRNEFCQFCQEPVSVALKPVAILPCGHAYHVMCGRTLLFGQEGAECTENICHKTTDQVQADKMRHIIESAVRRGDFELSDLKDPILRRDVLKRVNELMEESKRSDAHTVQTSSAVDDERTTEAYERRWKQTTVGRNGFSYSQKRRILEPFTSNLFEIKRESDITLNRLYQLDDALRQENQEEVPEEESTTASARLKSLFTVSRRVDSDVDTISMQRFMDAGLTIADLYFKMDIKAWSTLVDLGLTRKHLTNYKGVFPVTAFKDLYGVDYTAFVSDLKWSIEDIVRARITAKELSNVGLDFKKLYVDMGMQKQDLFALGYTPRDWSITLGMDKQYIGKPLNISDVDLHMLRWSPTEFVQAFALTPIELRHLNITSSTTAVAPPRLQEPVKIDTHVIERRLIQAQQLEAQKENNKKPEVPVLKRLVPETEARNGEGWGRSAKHVTVLSLDG